MKIEHKTPSPVSVPQSAPLSSPEIDIKTMSPRNSSSEATSTKSVSPKPNKLPNMFKCPECSFSTNQYASLEHHIMQHSPVVTKPTVSLPQSLQNDDASASESTFCAECNIHFSSVKTYQGHKEFYCEKRHRKSTAGSPGKEDLVKTSPLKLSPRLSMPSEPMSVDTKSLIAPHSAVVLAPPIISPQPVANGLPIAVPTVIMQPVYPIPTAPLPGPSKSASEEEKPLDLSVKKEATVRREEKSKSSTSTSRQSSPRQKSPVLLPSRKRLFDEVSSPRTSDEPATKVKAEERKASNKKCLDCNIEFTTHEIYLIHKEHYCTHRDSVVKPEIRKPDVSPDPISDYHPHSHHSAALSLIPQLLPPTFIKYYCVHCNIKFSSSDTLQAHQQFYCPKRKEVNGHRTPSPKITENHTVSSPKSPRSHSCEHCGITFLSADVLNSHIKVCGPALGNVSIYNCPYCKFVSYSEHHLGDHLKCHMATKYYSCRVCGYRGNTLRGMKMHGKVHADNNERFNFETDIEEIETDHKQEHVRSAGSPERDIGGMDLFLSFVTLREKYKDLIMSAPLMNGFSLHRGAPHVCVMCHQTFSDMSKLRDHMRSHSAEERTYICKYCEFGCGSKTDLVRHVKTAHETALASSFQENGEPLVRLESNTPVNVTVVDKQERKSEDNTEGDEVKQEKPNELETKENETEIVKVEAEEQLVTEESKKTNSSTISSPVQIVKPLSVRPVGPLSPVTDNVHVGPEATQNNLLLMKTDKSSPQYCKQCDITFMYYSTFVAHKKYYCSSHSSEKNV